MEDKLPNSLTKSTNKYSGWGWSLVVLVMMALVATGAAFTLWHWYQKWKSQHHHHTHIHRPPTAVDDEYANALGIAMQFFDVQKSGKLVDNRVTWRGDSGVDDGKEANLDLSKGLYDAGDNMKFGFPMAFTATMLSWVILEYGHHMQEVNQLEYAQDSLKWITDFLINAHPSDNVLYIQVGDPEVDHGCWERPEIMTEARPITQVNVTYPGTEVAAETAAALASASLVFKSINEVYSELLLKHAKQLFNFADTYRGSYSASIPGVQKYYNSSGYGDELLWASAWLYHATGDQSYLTYATVSNGNSFAGWGYPTWFSWNDKLPGVHVLLSRVSFFGSSNIPDAENLGLQKYRKTAEALMCEFLPDSLTATSKRTNGGLLWVSQWNPLQYSLASAFLSVLYSDYMFWSDTSTLYCDGNNYEPMDLRNFAMFQANYVLGSNPMKISYLVGYGNDYPQYIHHRGSSIPVNSNTGCKDGFRWLDSTAPNPNKAVGALVGGPFRDDTFIDSRNNSMQNEATTYNAAFMVGLLSGLLTFSPSQQSFT
ncbi:OLC1v1024286C1 [Oldenlandia corymbosa var. corymbosa]|uniref:Endoglucanase n=1 Tax=Oldenlandia corymbosa var. corymbosa TaxID=529605 RepID=A0AAV1C505_OLDCO|nr:OLC1v1024286C1 [Oldenlandia corymbosa var. corymbosa]